MFEPMQQLPTTIEEFAPVKRTMPAFQCKSQQAAALRCTFCTETRSTSNNNNHHFSNFPQQMEDRTCVRPVDSAPCDLNKILQGAMNKRSELVLRRCNKTASSLEIASAGQK